MGCHTSKHMSTLDRLDDSRHVMMLYPHANNTKTRNAAILKEMKRGGSFQERGPCPAAMLAMQEKNGGQRQRKNAGGYYGSSTEQTSATEWTVQDDTDTEVLLQDEASGIKSVVR